MATPSGFLSTIALPTMFALLIAGIWHGAGLQFVVFGLLHGLYLSVNHAWRLLRGRSTKQTAVQAAPSQLRHIVLRALSVLLTFTAVLLGQVFFRATSVHSAFSMLAALSGLHTAQSIAANAGTALSYRPSLSRLLSLGVGYLIVWCFPNTQQILSHVKPTLEHVRSDAAPARGHLHWRPTPLWGLGLGVVLLYVVVRMQNPTTFLYFQF